MEFITEIFEYKFLANAIIAALLTSISCGIIGTYIVSRKMVFISGGISHSSFGGIGIAYYFGFNPILGAGIFSIIAAVGIELLSKQKRLRTDSVIGILWSFGMAIGIIFIYMTPGYAPNLNTYLFGSILTVSQTDINFMLLITLAVGTFFALLFKSIVFIAFDEEYALTHTIPVKLINYILLALIALTIVVNIKVVGIILVISMLTIPQAIANIATQSFGKMMLFSILAGILGTFSGLAFADYFNIPSGASIIFTLIVLYVIARLANLIRVKFSIKYK